MPINNKRFYQRLTDEILDRAIAVDDSTFITSAELEAMKVELYEAIDAAIADAYMEGYRDGIRKGYAGAVGSVEAHGAE